MNDANRSQQVSAQLTASRKRIIYLSLLGNTIITLHILAAHTRKMFELRSYKQLRSCMDLANRIYESGNVPQQESVVDIYIDVLQELQSSCTNNEWHLVTALMPGSIHKEYIKHHHPGH